MASDILAQAEEACKCIARLDTVSKERGRGYDMLIELMPQLLAEAKRLQAEIEIYQMGEKAADRLILQGRADKEELEAWKAKAIEERAIAKSRFMNDILDEVRDIWMNCLRESIKTALLDESARELEEEMKIAI